MRCTAQHPDRQHLAQRPHHQRARAGQQQGAPEHGAPHHGQGALIVFAERFGDLARADGANAHGGDGRGGGHQARVKADQPDARGAKQDGNNLGAHQPDQDIDDRCPANDGRAFENAPVRRDLFGHANANAFSAAVTVAAPASSRCGPIGKLRHWFAICSAIGNCPCT